MNRYWVPGTTIGYEHTFLNALADFVMGIESGKPAQPDSAKRCRRSESATRCSNRRVTGKWMEHRSGGRENGLCR